jgi:hypothetical protein
MILKSFKPALGYLLVIVLHLGILRFLYCKIDDQQELFKPFMFAIGFDLTAKHKPVHGYGTLIMLIV